MRHRGLADLTAGREVAGADRPLAGELAQDREPSRIRGSLEEEHVRIDSVASCLTLYRQVAILANVDILHREATMIPSSLFIHVIEAERQHDLQLWQRTRARTAERPPSARQSRRTASGQRCRQRGLTGRSGCGTSTSTAPRLAAWHAADIDGERHDDQPEQRGPRARSRALCAVRPLRAGVGRGVLRACGWRLLRPGAGHRPGPLQRPRARGAAGRRGARLPRLREPHRRGRPARGRARPRPRLRRRHRRAPVRSTASAPPVASSAST